MNRYRIRMAWTATVGATAAAFAYPTFMPMTGSQFADYAVSALIVYSGGALGAIAIRRIEEAIRPRHPVIVGGSQPVKAQALARV